MRSYLIGLRMFRFKQLTYIGAVPLITFLRKLYLFVISALYQANLCTSVGEETDVWLHIDAAYAGSSFICPEFRPLLDGVEV